MKIACCVMLMWSVSSVIQSARIGLLLKARLGVREVTVSLCSLATSVTGPLLIVEV